MPSEERELESVTEESGPSPVETVRALGAELLQLNLSAFRLGYQGIAYHLLCAALHCAQGSGDRALADEVRQRADDQLKELEKSPGTEYARLDGIRGRSAVTMFESVAVMAASVRQRLKSRRPPPRA